MAVKNTSFGRKNISSAVYKLILLASALRESFDAVELSAVQSRFGISSEEAAILMELLQLTDENGYLPLLLTGDQDTLTLVGESPFTARRLVLTDEETLALKEAFTALALPQESVFWSLLKPPYTRSSSPDGSSVSLVSKSHSKEVDAFLTCSEATAEEIDAEVRRIVEEGHQRALQTLKENRFKLHEIAHYLQKKETITGEEFMNILKRENTFAPVVENTNEEGSSTSSVE